MPSYILPDGVNSQEIQNRAVISTREGGYVVGDQNLLSIWRQATGQKMSQIIEDTRFGDPLEIRAALACLAEANLLSRDSQTVNQSVVASTTDIKISVITVSFNSQKWLTGCLPSVYSQTHPIIELIVVDNASSDNTVLWLKEHYPDIKILRLEQTQPLSHALNTGVNEASGDYYLLLNPDVTLEPSAVAEMVAVASVHPDSAAVAAKLMLLSTPAFINGIGNYVGPISWGTDYGLGHLDLGQFDRLREVPSACFAAALISRAAYDDIGPFDDKFHLYYEDSEWCYRARLFGYKILAAPSAVGFHAFGSRLTSHTKNRLDPVKFEQVVFGRLRFAFKLLSPLYLLYFLSLYIVEDCARLLVVIFKGRWSYVNAYFRAWSNLVKSIGEILGERKKVQGRRKIPDHDLFLLHKDIPMPLIWHGIPELTWDIIRRIYLPRILAGETKPLPEFEPIPLDQLVQKTSSSPIVFLKRAGDILSAEGYSGLVHRIGRTIQWHLMRP
ncbi:glycosyltransferase family 2 protein [Chloroflexota bacterium]